MKKYIIHWKSRVTDATGYGKPISQEAAEWAVERANKERPGLHHWIECAEEEPNDST